MIKKYMQKIARQEIENYREELKKAIWFNFSRNLEINHKVLYQGAKWKVEKTAWSVFDFEIKLKLVGSSKDNPLIKEFVLNYHKPDLDFDKYKEMVRFV